MNRKHGFTLIELCVVMAIIAVAVSIAIPNMIGRRAEREFSSALNQSIAMMNSARVVALKENTHTIIVFNANEGTYRSFVDISGDREWNPAVDRLVNFYRLPAGVQISGSTFLQVNQVPGRYYCIFNTHGMPSRTGRIVLAGRKGLTSQVILSITGRIRVE